MALTLTIWHNSRCSKSRQTLALLREQGVEPIVRNYLEDAPNRAEIDRAATCLGLSAAKFLRRGETEYKQSGLSNASSEDEIRDAMARFPKLIERPIVFSGDRAAPGRPPENVLSLL